MQRSRSLNHTHTQRNAYVRTRRGNARTRSKPKPLLIHLPRTNAKRRNGGFQKRQAHRRLRHRLQQGSRRRQGGEGDLKHRISLGAHSCRSLQRLHHAPRRLLCSKNRYLFFSKPFDKSQFESY